MENKINPYTHYYLYAKGWYKENDILDDLRSVQANYSGISKKFISNSDVYSTLLPLVYSEIKNSGNPEYYFVTFSSNCEKLGLPSDCLIILSLSNVLGKNIGKPDSSVLPLAEQL